MSRGLGTFQRDVLGLLASDIHPDGWTPSALARCLFHTPTQIDKRQVREALRALEKRGLARIVGRAERDAPLWVRDSPPPRTRGTAKGRRQSPTIRSGVLRGLDREALNERRAEQGLPPRDDRGLVG